MAQNDKNSLEESEAKNDILEDEMTTKLSEMRVSKRMANFTIIASDGTKFHVQKNILGEKSPVFDKIFKDDTKVQNFDISDFSTDTIMQFIKYLYSDAIEDDQDVFELFEIAATYKVHKLMSICEEILLNNLHSSNSVQVFTLAHRFDVPTLKQKAFESIKRILKRENLPIRFLDNPKDVEKLVNSVHSRERKIREVKKRQAGDIEEALEEFELMWKKANRHL